MGCDSECHHFCAYSENVRNTEGDCYRRTPPTTYPTPVPTRYPTSSPTSHYCSMGIRYRWKDSKTKAPCV